MEFLTKPLLQINEYKEALDAVKNYKMPVSITGPSDSQKAHICHAICSHAGIKAVYISYNEMQARKLYDDFALFYGSNAVFFPSKDITLYDIEAKSHDTIYERIAALERIIEGRYNVIIIPAEAMIQKLIPADKFLKCIINISEGERIDLQGLIQKLISTGYERTSTVEGKGQFAVRGGIIDIFAVNYTSPIRIELFDDEVDSIRKFDIITQRSIDKLKEIKVMPAREMIYTPEEREEIIRNIKKDLKTAIARAKKDNQYCRNLSDKIHADIEAIENSYYFPGIDRYTSNIIKNPSTILDYLQRGTVIFVDEPLRMEQRIKNIILEHQELCKNFIERAAMLPDSADILFDENDIYKYIDRAQSISLFTLPSNSERLIKSRVFSVPCRQLNSYENHMDLLIEDIKRWKKNSYRTVVLAGTRGKGERLEEVLKAKDIECSYIESPENEILPGQVVITRGSLVRGFEYPTAKFAVVSDRELFGYDRRLKRAARKKKGRKIEAFTDLNVGDLVVHETYGIGQYEGIHKLEVDGVKSDYLKIRYQQGDYLYIPANQMDSIQKYIGSEGRTPKLSKLGGTDWVKTKAKVKESLKKLAFELVELYAKRQAMKGHAYSKDTVWQSQFEELFPYEETDDQIKCIQEIKQDMESERPMDRLLCGDVGFGKTEVAMRAIFKAVMDGKQVAYLVPTTILAQQHYHTFRQRMADFPITVDVISRFRTASEQKKILKNLKSGNIDILIGTHRLLQKDVEFKDLGLLVIDEEQRFGVEHKEKVKNMYPNIDVLTLTATPIPRTLHMSLSGIRDISTIEEPPEERYPVQTYVMEYNQEIIKDAILREMARKGQVFYLYNRVRTIYMKASELHNLVPEARIAVAHGQMNEKELEDVMMDFINGESDILVCTTIIESGLDMPNVNTIIVEDSDRMGLSQLYQIRGRVGRSNKLGYAYITYKKDKVLAEAAEKRLQAIKEFTEFGSGFKIAMRDLEIRGAGNLLGPEQHGHMETVGYDMYCKLLDEAVREIKGEEIQRRETEVTIDINISAYIDDEYINDEKQKLDMYKRIASIQDEEDVSDIQDELIDRYGDIPDEVNNLINIALIKSMASRCNFASVQQKDNSVIFQYAKGAKVNLEVLSKLMDKYKRKLMFTASASPYITYKITNVAKSDLIENIKILLQDINKLQ